MGDVDQRTLRRLERLLDAAHELAHAHRAPVSPNLLEWAGVSERELSHSAVLARFLDPRGDHGEGPRFLDAFLSMLANRGAFALSGVRCTRPSLTHVYTEYVVPSGRRIDLVVFLPPWGVVAIENKVWAAEQEKQVSDYAKWATDQWGSHAMVFVTPDGRKAATAGIADGEVAVSYADLAAWLRGAAWDTAPAVRWIVGQYADLCDRIHREATGGTAVGDSVPEDVRLRLFSDVAKIESALQMAEWLDRYHADLQRDFWQSLWNAVTEELGRERLSAKGWLAKRDIDPLVEYGGLGIYSGTPPEQDRKAPWLTGRCAVRIQQERGRLYYGIAWGREVRKSPASVEDRKAFKDSGLRQSSDWWAAWDWMPSDHGYILARTSLRELYLQVETPGGRELQRQIARKLVELVAAHGPIIIALDEALRASGGPEAAPSGAGAGAEA